MSEPAVQTNGLTRCFGSVAAVSDLDLHVPQGVIYGLIGPNGAGKTTIIRLLLGLLQPSSGDVSVLGRDPIAQGDNVRCRTGTVLEPCGLYERLSAWENLDYHGRIWHIPSDERKVRAEELLKVMGLWDRRDEIISEWGRGLKQRLCIARSLFHHPELVLMDEPNAGLDSTVVDEISVYLSTLVEQSGVTIIMATNNLTVADSTCHSVTILNEGRVLASGKTDTIRSMGPEPIIEIEGRGITDEVISLLLRRPEVTSSQRVNHRLELQLAAHVDTAPLVSLLIESGVDVSEVRKTKSSLKSAFGVLLQKDTGEKTPL